MKTNNIIYIFLSIVFLSSCNKNNKPEAYGTFEAVEVIVSSEATGKILDFNIIEGQELAENQIAGYIDSTQLYLRKQQLIINAGTVDANKPEINKQIAALEHQIKTAKIEKQRIENLIKSDAANTKQLDDINAQIILYEKQLEAQKSNLKINTRSITGESSALEIQIAQLQDQIDKCKIKSPIKGRVLVTYAEKGEFATIGKALFKIADTDNMILRAYITSEQLANIKIGNKVKIFADYGNDKTKEYLGEIIYISDKAEFTPKSILTDDERASLVYAVKIAVKNDGYLKIGMSGYLEFENN
jgi:HlyD family secretion protein